MYTQIMTFNFSSPLYETIDHFYIKNLILKISNMYSMYNKDFDTKIIKYSFISFYT